MKKTNRYIKLFNQTCLRAKQNHKRKVRKKNAYRAKRMIIRVNNLSKDFYADKKHTLNEKISWWDYSHNPDRKKIYSKEIQDIFKVIADFFERSEAIQGYNPHKMFRTFKRCNNFIPDYYHVGFVTEWYGVQSDAVTLYPKN